MQESEMQRLAGLMAEAIKGQIVGEAVQMLRTDFPELHYV
jgi:hypothetical protein